MLTIPSKRLIAQSALFLCLAVALVAAGYLLAKHRLKDELGAGPQVVYRDPPEQEESPQRRSPQYVRATDASIQYEDVPNSGMGEGRALRRFTITVSHPNSEQYLVAANLQDPDWMNDISDEGQLITQLADINAAFSEMVAIDLPAPSHWRKAKVHIGGFAQDLCGDAEAVYSFRNSTVFAISFVSTKEIDLSESQCPLSVEEYVANKVKFGEPEEGLGDFTNYCTVRSKCIKEYFENPDNQSKLLTKWHKQISEVELH